MYRAFFLASAVTAIFVVPARGQVTSNTPDTTLVSETLVEYDQRFRYSVLLDPFALYSRTFGFGIRAHVTAYNLLWVGSRFRVIVKPYQRRGFYALTLRTHDPAKSNFFGLLRTSYDINNAYRYYGIGQSTSEDDRIYVKKDQLEVAGRLGIQFFDDLLTLQPTLGYLWNRADDFEERVDSAFVNLDARSQEALLYATGMPGSEFENPPTDHSGVRVGLEVAVDKRDRIAYPLSGYRVSAAWSRYFSLNDLDVEFDALNASVNGFIDLGTDHVLALRAMVKTTRQQGDDPIPFYYLPRLEFSLLGGMRGNRHVNADLTVVSAEYRFPFINLVDLYQVSGFCRPGVGGVYDDIWSDFELDLSFKKNLDENSLALRPGFGVGIRVSGLENNRDMMYWMLGFGPEGFTLAAFRFVFELGDIL